ncbi:uncharacterized protein LOC114294643 isoform X2 [Camellia sinensis]|uniref:uncharacterized protein LOC114294643 isoform X2 n=1 Tax=Camellia sinensis TaxID=4442 RepID=UPI0010366D01|nr:uncharacterized protein LOC114294643 isoform X2 [Camellia sinensis]
MWRRHMADRCLTRYAFENGHEAHIRHGKIEIDGISVEKSFLCFETKSKAEDVRDNLSNLKGDSFLKPCMIVLHEERHWLAVDRFDYSLERYCYHNQERWDNSRVLLDRKDAKLGDPNPKEEVTRYQLKPTYRQIVCDIITGIYQLHSQKYWHGDLSITDILIVNDRAKFAFLRGARGGSPDKRGEDFEKLRKVFKEVLGVVKDRQSRMPRTELNHFHKNAAPKINNWPSLAKLFFHPLLMTPMQRFHLPVMMRTIERYSESQYQWLERRPGGGPTGWKEKVRGDYKEILSYRKNNTCKCKCKSTSTSTSTSTCTCTCICSEHQDKKEYKDDDWDQFTFVRNTIVHINDSRNKNVDNATSSGGSNKPKKTARDVEQELSVMLTSSFTNVYNLFNGKALASTSVQIFEE